MSNPLKELHNNSNASVSSYETAWSSSFSARKSLNQSENQENVKIKEEPHDEEYDENVSILENNISMLSVSSPKSPSFRTPARNSKTQRNPMTPGDRLLQSVKKDEDRALLRQLYPEMFKDEAPPPPESSENFEKKEKKVIKKEIDFDEKENIPPGGVREKKVEIEEKKTKTRSKKIQISSSESEDDDFENYLKSLKTKPEVPKEPKKVERKVVKKFVVEDVESSEEEESEYSEEEEEDDDDDYRESSPEVEEIPKKQKKATKKAADDEEWFLQSLTEGFDGPIHKDAKQYIKENALRQKKRREALLEHLQDILVRRIFHKIPSDQLKVTWNARLHKSAGQCRNHRNGHSTVEMSKTVCTTAERLRDTLVHELCHAAVWVVDRLHKEGHGPGWKRWGSRCTKEFKSLPFVERCHSYEIEAKFYYVCENEFCRQEIKRQSKSFDTSRKVCGKCHGRFELYRFCRRTNRRIKIEDPKTKKKEPEPVREPRATDHLDDKFAEFVKENYWNYTSMKHSAVMEKLAEQFKKLQD